MLKIPIEIESKEKQRLFLDYLNSKLLDVLSSHSGQAGYMADGSFESLVTGGLSIDDQIYVVTWKIVKSPDGDLKRIEVISEGETSDQENWGERASGIVTSSLAAALDENTEKFFIRRTYYYVGPQLDGEYWLPGFRFSPANPNDLEPGLINAERPVYLEANIEAIDSRHSLGIANEFMARQAARLSLLLNVGLYKADQSRRWAMFRDEDDQLSSERYQLGYVPSSPPPNSFPKKGEFCELGSYEGDLRAKYQVAGELLSMPPEARRLLRLIDQGPQRLNDAFDRCSRLYQVGSVIGSAYPTVGLAYRVAAVEAVTHAIEEFDSFSGFIRTYADPRPHLNEVLNFLYKSVRSAHFHGGQFPLGEYSAQSFFDPLMDSEKIDEMSIRTEGYQITREAIVKWLLSELEGN